MCPNHELQPQELGCGTRLRHCAGRNVVLRPCDYMADLELAVVWQGGIYCDAAGNVQDVLTSEKYLGS